MLRGNAVHFTCICILSRFNFEAKLVCLKFCWHWNENNDVFFLRHILPSTYRVYVALGQMTKTYQATITNKLGNYCTLHAHLTVNFRLSLLHIELNSLKSSKEMSAWNFKWFYYFSAVAVVACCNKWLAVLEFHLNCRYFEVQDEVRTEKLAWFEEQPK